MYKVGDTIYLEAEISQIDEDDFPYEVMIKTGETFWLRKIPKSNNFQFGVNDTVFSKDKSGKLTKFKIKGVCKGKYLIAGIELYNNIEAYWREWDEIFPENVFSDYSDNPYRKDWNPAIFEPVQIHINNEWFDAEIVDIDAIGSKFKVALENTSFSTWCGIEKLRKPKKLPKFRVGDTVEAIFLDANSGRWEKAKVIEVREDFSMPYRVEFICDSAMAIRKENEVRIAPPF